MTIQHPTGQHTTISNLVGAGHAQCAPKNTINELGTSFITKLLLGHSHSTYLFGMFFRYWWRYPCFLPTLCPSCCLVHLGFRHISNANLTNHNRYTPDRTDTFVTWLGRGSSYVSYLKEWGGGAYNRDGVSSPYKNICVTHGRIALKKVVINFPCSCVWK